MPDETSMLATRASANPPPRRRRNHIRQLLTAVAALAGVSVLAAACGSSASTTTAAAALPGKGKPTIIMGDKNFAEEYILGQLYTQAFEAKGYTVDLKANIGGTALINSVMLAGKINAYPEYIGEIASTLAKIENPLPSEAATEAAAEKFEHSQGYTLMKPLTPFYDKDQVAVPNAFAQKYHLTSIAQLKSLGPLKYCDYPSEKTRYEGFLGLQEAYGLTNLQFVPLSPGLQYAAMNDGQCQVADVFSTDPQLLSGKYTILKNPKHIFGFQNVGLVIKTSLLKELGAPFQKTYTQLTDLLTIPVMQALDKAVEIDKQDPQAVAHSFLKANHLLGP